MCTRCDSEWICGRCGTINHGDKCLDCGYGGPVCDNEEDDDGLVFGFEGKPE